MAEKTKTSPSTVAVEFSYVNFGRRMFFNRFEVVPDGDFRIVHFGYVPSTNLTVDHFACAIHREVLEAQRKENEAYLGRLGELSFPEPEKWHPPASSFRVELVNHLGFCRRGSEAEIALHNFSVKALLDLAKTNRPNVQVPSEAIALLRSDGEIHKHLISALYPRI